MSNEIQNNLEKIMRRYYSLAKCQAEHRNQIWDLDFETFCQIWSKDDKYKNRGRGSENYHMRRINVSDSWNDKNVEIVTRGKHLSDLMLEKNQYVRG